MPNSCFALVEYYPFPLFYAYYINDKAWSIDIAQLNGYYKASDKREMADPEMVPTFFREV